MEDEKAEDVKTKDLSLTKPAETSSEDSEKIAILKKIKELEEEKALLKKIKELEEEVARLKREANLCDAPLVERGKDRGKGLPRWRRRQLSYQNNVKFRGYH